MAGEMPRTRRSREAQAGGLCHQLLLILVQRCGHELHMGAFGVDTRAGALGVLQFVGIDQEGRQKRPLAADEGLHRVHPAEVALQEEDAEAALGHGQAGPGNRGFHEISAEVLDQHGQEFGHGLHFMGPDVDAAPARAAVAALFAVEYRLFCRIISH